ncbi:CDP-alcohol phosphatidyltransferase family protein [Haloferax sp. YSSS75]|uniref:CDP-alcohol phosphatidyltransferase family protein n=1 Tax=Haloferax sp. YSSS75 TaxID=3388564 RepID=UPI00398CF105
MSDRPTSTATDRTRRRLLASGAVAITGVVSVGWVLATTSALSVPLVATWTATTTLVALGLWTYTSVYAAENVADGESEHAYETVGLPTGVTLLRGTVAAGISGIAVVAMVGTPTVWLAWVAAVAYGLVGALDSVDGFLARRFDRTTRLGGRLDTAVDAFALLVAPLAGVALGELPWWYLSVGVARYAFVAGLWWRTQTGRPTFDLPPRPSRRVLAGLQMAVVPLALAPAIADAWMPLVVGVAAGGLLVGFCRDWLYVSGRLESGGRRRANAPTRD